MDAGSGRIVAQAFTVYFELINVAEDASRVRVLRERERSLAPVPMEGSIAHALCAVRDAAVPIRDVQRVLSNLRIEVVLTSHPTEVKRRTVMSKLNRIAAQLDRIAAVDTLPREYAECVQGVRSEIAGLWLTNRSRGAKPDVGDETRNSLYLVENIFWDTMPHVVADLQAAVNEFFPGIQVPDGWLQLGAWAGGDRDGNPAGHRGCYGRGSAHASGAGSGAPSYGLAGLGAALERKQLVNFYVVGSAGLAGCAAPFP